MRREKGQKERRKQVDEQESFHFFRFHLFAFPICARVSRSLPLFLSRDEEHEASRLPAAPRAAAAPAAGARRSGGAMRYDDNDDVGETDASHLNGRFHDASLLFFSFLVSSSLRLRRHVHHFEPRGTRDSRAAGRARGGASRLRGAGERGAAAGAGDTNIVDAERRGGMRVRRRGVVVFSRALFFFF
jgi:hypothetical protein